MATKQSNLKSLEIPDLEKDLKILNSLESEFNSSYLQAKLDYLISGKNTDKFSDIELRLIVIDKLLKLKFQNEYIVLIDPNMLLLNDEEKEIIKSVIGSKELPKSLSQVKMVFTDKKKNKIYPFMIDDKEYILYLIDDKNLNIMVEFIHNQLIAHEK